MKHRISRNTHAVTRIWSSAACLVWVTLFNVQMSETVDAGKTGMVRAAAETAIRKLGGKSARYTVDSFEKRLSVMVRKHGNDARTALNKVGPHAFKVVDDAGPHADAVVKLMAKRGDEALWVVSRKNRLAIFIKHGDDAAEAMIKHKEIIEPLLKEFGQSAGAAAMKINVRNGRRLAIMHADKSLASIGRTPELLRVINTYGDAAMAFIWKNKGPLAVGSVLTAFLADPQAFIRGGNELVENVADNTVGPIANATASEVAKRTNWTVVIIVLGLGALILLWFHAFRTRVSATASELGLRKNQSA